MAVAVSAAALTGVGRSIGDLVSACPGYSASNVKTTASGLTADLTLAGKSCDVYGTDLKNLVLEVSYDTGRARHLLSKPLSNGPSLTLSRLEASRQNPRCRE
jgi:alpha-glucosidase